MLKIPPPFFLLLPLFVVASMATEDPAPDILIADFEGDTYGNWTVEGRAFGPGPAKGGFPGQMTVSGYQGRGLVNTFFEGDGTTGKLISPKFRVERPYISFLIGGGGHEGLGIFLLVDGKRVREATGPNTVPGGSEALQWHDWDVVEFRGQEAVIEIVDEATGGWGHINVDQVVQSNKKRQWGEKRREITIEKDYLHIPIRMDEPVSRVRIEVGGTKWLDLEMPLTFSGEPDFLSNLYVADHKGQTLTFTVDQAPEDFTGFDRIVQAETMAQEDGIYTERLRPRFHFSARTGWINDPNGLLYYKGVWHLFFQHNPYSTRWGNMTWGHATSPDLFHWTEHPAALHPDASGTMFSGSGVVDWNNTSGFGGDKSRDDDPPLVLIYTAWGQQARPAVPVTQGIAYSNDAGKTFTKYSGNPVVEQLSTENRDPKVIRHEPSKQWIMALYLEKEDYVLLGSKDLKTWETLSEIKNLGCSECPDFFPLPVDGDPENVKWIFWGANGKYLVGSFDGREFHKETEPLNCKYGGHDYAAMTFSDAPDGRRIQMAWMSNGDGVHAGMPFNHQMSVPRELTLRTTPQGVRLFMNPVKELETLRQATAFPEIRDRAVTPGHEHLIMTPSPCFDAEMTVDVGTASKVIFHVVGRRVEYDVAKKQIALDDIRAPLELPEGTLKLRLVADTTSLELFAQDGEVQIAKCFRRQQDTIYLGIECAVEGGQAVLKDAQVWKIKSVWP